MTQTQRSVAEVYAILPDNVTEDISPQDLRDALETWLPGHGSIYVPAAAAAAITIPNTADYVECTAPAWSLHAGGHLFDESDGNGRLTYTGVANVIAHISASVSMTSGSNGQVTHWRLGINGTPDASSESQRKIGTGTDVGALAIHEVAELATGDHISLFVRNATAANDVTVEVAQIAAITIPE